MGGHFSVLVFLDLAAESQLCVPFLLLGHSLNICDLCTCWLSFVSWLLSGFNPELRPFPLDALFQVALISPRLFHHLCAKNVLIYIFVLNCFTFAC